MGLRPVFLNPRTLVRTWGTRPELMRAEEWIIRPLPAASLLGCDFDSHGAGRALDALYCGFHRDGVQVGHLLLGDLEHLGFAYLAHLVLVRGTRTLGQVGRLLQQDRCRWRLGNEGEGAIHVDGDDYGDNEPGHFLVLRARIELLAEFHDV